MVTGDPESLQTLHGDKGNPIDPDLGYDIKATGDALNAEGKLPKLHTHRSKHMFEEALKKSTDKRKKKVKSRDFQLSLKDESNSGDVDSDVAPWCEGEKITMSDFDGAGDDSQDKDFSKKADVEESESSSEEVQIVGYKRKATGEVKQHLVKKAGGSFSASTYKSSAKSTP